MCFVGRVAFLFKNAGGRGKKTVAAVLFQPIGGKFLVSGQKGGLLIGPGASFCRERDVAVSRWGWEHTIHPPEAKVWRIHIEIKEIIGIESDEIRR